MLKAWSGAERPGGSRLGRRLFALFVLLAIVPLALSGLVSEAALTRIAEGLDQTRRAQSTRVVSRQVLDRLLAARTLLQALPGEPASPATGASLPGQGSVFRQLILLDGQGRPVWGSGTAAGIVVTDPGGRAGEPGHGAAPFDVPSEPSAVAVQAAVRLLAVPAGPDAGLWLTRPLSGGWRWVAALDPTRVWSPLQDAGDDLAWVVRDARGRALFQTQGGDFPAWAPGPGQAGEAGEAGQVAGFVDTSARLFLGGEFGSGEWQFTQRSPRPSVQWLGRRLVDWLVLVGLGTLLLIAWLGLWQIRRTLQPLQALTEGTRQLAAGDRSARVAVRQDDEIGTLAHAFNEMADRIGAQFEAMAGRSRIDRDILAGADMAQLVEHVLQRLAAELPGSSVSLSWSEGAGTLHGARLARGRGQPHTIERRTLELPPPLQAQFSALVDGAGHSADLAGTAPLPWLPPGGADTRSVLLTVGTPGHTHAVIALAVPADAPDAALDPARDLRDRLGVALATRSRERELVYQATHDSLTGLTNRLGLHQQLDAWLAARQGVSLLFIDLDHFKDLNDTQGHAAGDAMLCQVGARLRACAPAGAQVARQGGDEFAILLPGADDAGARALAAAVLRSLAQPYELAHGEHVAGASIGISLSPGPAGPGDDLLRRADLALYAAKAAGRGRFQVFSEDLDASARQRVRLVTELRRAIEQREFVMHFQPRVRPADGAIRSAEALVRWQHPARGLIPPGQFVEVMESAGLAEALGDAVLEMSCAQIAAWWRAGLLLDRVSVNVSAQQLDSGLLPRKVLDLLRRHGLPPRLLELEVTESQLAGDARSAHRQLAELRAAGVTIALDDFGTGFSAMATLRQLPLDVMKVDRAFVVDMCTDAGARAVVEAIVALAKSLGLHLVAEGVEEVEQAQLLRTLGCDELQGFLYSRALPAAAFEALPALERGPAPGAAVSPVDARDRAAVQA